MHNLKMGYVCKDTGTQPYRNKNVVCIASISLKLLTKHTKFNLLTCNLILIGNLVCNGGIYNKFVFIEIIKDLISNIYIGFHVLNIFKPLNIQSNQNYFQNIFFSENYSATTVIYLLLYSIIIIYISYITL